LDIQKSFGEKEILPEREPVRLWRKPRNTTEPEKFRVTQETLRRTVEGSRLFR
jgi:hypothetical protein